MKYPRILITRTQPGASQLAVRIMDMNLPVHIAPILCAQATHTPAPDALADAGGIILTSPHGLRHATLPHWTDKAKPLYAVGAATAQYARDGGWTNVIEGPGDITGLGAVLRTQAKGQNLIHIRGAQVSPFTESALEGLGVTPWITYETRPDMHSLSSIPKFLSMPGKHVVLLQSARAAGFLKECVHAYADRLAAKEISVLCLSKAVLESLQIKGQPQISTGLYSCEHPNEDALLEHLSTLIDQMMET